MFIWINVFFYTGVVYYLRSKRSWCWRSCYVDLDHCRERVGLSTVELSLGDLDPLGQR